jgi:hypothetical protein
MNEKVGRGKDEEPNDTNYIQSSHRKEKTVKVAKVQKQRETKDTKREGKTSRIEQGKNILSLLRDKTRFQRQGESVYEEEASKTRR